MTTSTANAWVGCFKGDTGDVIVLAANPAHPPSRHIYGAPLPALKASTSDERNGGCRLQDLPEDAVHGDHEDSILQGN